MFATCSKMLLMILALVDSLVVHHQGNKLQSPGRRRTTGPPTMVIGRFVRKWRNSDEIVGPYCTTKAVVVGASGNVGKLVTARMLEEGYCVTAIVRSWAAGDALYDFLQKEHVCPNMPEIIIADMCSDTSRPALQQALKGAERVVVTTGTTAFPTTAWAGGRVDTEDVKQVVWNSLVGHSFDTEQTMKHLDGLGMNTPDRVDGDGVERIAECLDPRALRRVVLMSSVGVTRRHEFPFTILNSMGVLDAKARGEDAIKQRATAIGAEYSIVRPGQLFGPPYSNNVYLGTLLQLDKDSKTQALSIHKGDVAKGDTLREALADVLVHTLDCSATRNSDFSVYTCEGKKPTKEIMDEQLHDVLMPRPVSSSSSGQVSLA